MFCVTCGSQLPSEAANFCTGCGAPVKRTSAPETPATPQPDPPAPAPRIVEAPAAAIPVVRPAPVISSAAPSKCPWCGASVDASNLDCPRCGASLRSQTETTQSGWVQLPGRRDMAKLQFGDSFCQIEGKYVPVADMNLAADGHVYFAHHVLLWKDTAVNISVMPLAGGWSRMFAGLPLIMAQANGPGHIAFSHDAPGELIALPLMPGDQVDVREHLFLTASINVAYDWFQTGVWFVTGTNDEQETHRPLGQFMDRFSATDKPGLLLLHAAGDVFVRTLEPGQTMLVKPTALVFKDPSVMMHLHFEHVGSGPGIGSMMGGGSAGSVAGSVIGSMLGRGVASDLVSSLLSGGSSQQYGSSVLGGVSWGARHMWLRLQGPGRVAVQSVFERADGENRYLRNCSAATDRRW
jgi:uncharacterized protein (AIM24 family)